MFKGPPFELLFLLENGQRVNQDWTLDSGLAFFFGRAIFFGGGGGGGGVVLFFLVCKKIAFPQQAIFLHLRRGGREERTLRFFQSVF